MNGVDNGVYMKRRFLLISEIQKHAEGWQLRDCVTRDLV